jgi:hypothetical protein
VPRSYLGRISSLTQIEAIHRWVCLHRLFAIRWPHEPAFARGCAAELRELDNLSDQETVEIKTRPLPFDGRRTGSVCVVGPRRADSSMLVIIMPSSVEFTALTTLEVRIPVAAQIALTTPTKLYEHLSEILALK